MTALTATAEELELQNQVTKTLETQGVLGKIKAQLRVAVFQAIHGGSGGNGVGSTGSLASRSSLSALIPSANRLSALGLDGQVAAEIVRNFLECLELEHTLTVFLAEANLGDGEKDGKQSEWRQPSRLCDRVGVAKTDEQMPVLVKMLRSGDQEKTLTFSQTKLPLVNSRSEEQPQATEKRSVEVNAKVEMTREVATAKLDLPAPPVAASLSAKGTTIEKEEEGDDEGEMEASMAEEVASGSFEEESLAESASLSHSRNDDYGYKPTSQATQRPGRLDMRDEEEDEESPAIASPPPVPAKLGTMPPLPGMSTTSMVAKPVKHQSDEKEEEQGEEEGGGEEEEEQGEEEGELEDDDDDAAARLRSLEAKLKEMEAEDDTGVLQQLKVAKLEDPDDDGGSEKLERDDTSEKNGHDDDDDDDNYGSDFEEVEEDMDEVGSEMSEDIASMSALSESEEISVAKAKVKDGLENDQAVENEDALNSYDYIEAVERD